MKKLFIVANWKSNKTEIEAKEWLQKISSPSVLSSGSKDIKYDVLSIQDKEVIVCPSFTALSFLKSSITSHKSSIKLGAQNISPFEPGAYTGEVNGQQIKEFADYVTIGHSERRENFGETDEVLEKKVNMAHKFNLIPIFCVQNSDTVIPVNVNIVAYEPIFAIGSNNPDTPENADKIASIFKNKNKSVQYVLYGGSVNSQNVKSFTQMENIDGVLVGGASLDANEFLKLINNA